MSIRCSGEKRARNITENDDGIDYSLCSSLVKLVLLRGENILVDALLLLLDRRALDNHTRSRVESVTCSVTMGLLCHRKVLRQIVILTASGLRCLILLVSFLLVLHVVEGAGVAEVLILLFVIVGTTRFRFTGVSRVGTYIFDVVVDLAELLVYFLVLYPIRVVLDHPLVLLVRSDLHISSLVVPWP